MQRLCDRCRLNDAWAAPVQGESQGNCSSCGKPGSLSHVHSLSDYISRGEDTPKTKLGVSTVPPLT